MSTSLNRQRTIGLAVPSGDTSVVAAFARAASLCLAAGDAVVWVHRGTPPPEDLHGALRVESWPEAVPPIEAPEPLRYAGVLFFWLKEQAFDAVLTGPCEAFYAALARRQGLALERLFIGLLAPPMGPDTADRLPRTADDLCTQYMERMSRSLADAVWEVDGIPPDLAQHLGPRHVPPAASPPAVHPLVSVCLIHYNRPALLRQALASIEAQDYAPFEVVLVDDASPDPAAKALLDELAPVFAARGWTLLRQPHNSYLGACRNLAARHARGAYLLFMDDDDLAMPRELRTFVEVASRTGAHVLTCAADEFTGDQPPAPGTVPLRRRLSLGGAIAAGFTSNLFGPANLFVQREAFLEAGPFSEDKGLAFEDWEWCARAALKGLKLETIPMPLFWYRRGRSDSMLAQTAFAASLRRPLRAYEAAVPAPLAELVRFCFGRHLHAGSVEKELAEVRGQHAALQRSHEALRGEHAALQQAHAALRGEHEVLRQVHDAFASRLTIRLADRVSTWLKKLLRC